MLKGWNYFLNLLPLISFNFPMFDWGEITPTSELSNWKRDSIDSKLKVHFLVVNFPHFDGSTAPFCATIFRRLPVSPASPAATDRRRGGFRRRAKCWRRGGPGVAGTSHSHWIPLMWIKKAKHATDYRIGIMSLIQLDHLVLSTPKIFKIFVRSWSQVWKNRSKPDMGELPTLSENRQYKPSQCGIFSNQNATWPW